MRDFVNRLGNLFMPALLRSPLHFLVSGSLMLITFTGRKSGKQYTTPVQYKKIDDSVIVFTRRDRVWWKNLRGGAPVMLRIGGRNWHGTTRTITADENRALMLERAQVMYPRLPQTAREDIVAQSVLIQIQLTLPA